MFSIETKQNPKFTLGDGMVAVVGALEAGIRGRRRPAAVAAGGGRVRD